MTAEIIKSPKTCPYRVYDGEDYECSHHDGEYIVQWCDNPEQFPADCPLMKVNDVEVKNENHS